MSEPESPNELQADSAPEGGVLAALPRTRPQRASPRRVAARGKTSKSETAVSARQAATSPGKPKARRVPSAKSAKKAAPRARVGQAKAGQATTAPKTPPNAKLSLPSSTPQKSSLPSQQAKPSRARPPRAKPPEPPAPKQGYEPEEEVERGATVNPPSGAELVESVADIVGELAGSGLAAGGRLLKDAFSVLRRP